MRLLDQAAVHATGSECEQLVSATWTIEREFDALFEYVTAEFKYNIVPIRDTVALHM